MWRHLVLVGLLGSVVAAAGDATIGEVAAPQECTSDPVSVDLICRRGHRLVREAVGGRWRPLPLAQVRCGEDDQGACVFTWRDCEPAGPDCAASLVTVAPRATIVFGDPHGVVRFRCVETTS
jgi:hypothetical protein